MIFILIILFKSLFFKLPPPLKKTLKTKLRTMTKFKKKKTKQTKRKKTKDKKKII